MTRLVPIKALRHLSTVHTEHRSNGNSSLKCYLRFKYNVFARTLCKCSHIDCESIVAGTLQYNAVLTLTSMTNLSGLRLMQVSACNHGELP
jgi:hypothetical protein